MPGLRHAADPPTHAAGTVAPHAASSSASKDPAPSWMDIRHRIAQHCRPPRGAPLYGSLIMPGAPTAAAFVAVSQHDDTRAVAAVLRDVARLQLGAGPPGLLLSVIGAQQVPPALHPQLAHGITRAAAAAGAWIITAGTGRSEALVLDALSHPAVWRACWATLRATHRA